MIGCLTLTEKNLHTNSDPELRFENNLKKAPNDEKHLLSRETNTAIIQYYLIVCA